MDRKWHPQGMNPAGQIVQNIIQIRMMWRNAGNSPAVRTNLIVDKKIVPIGDPIPVFDSSEEPDASPVLVGPGMEVLSSAAYIFEDDRKRAQQREMAIYLYGRATYSDIIRADRHYSEVCLLIEFNGTETLPNGVRVPMMEGRPIGHQNDAT